MFEMSDYRSSVTRMLFVHRAGPSTRRMIDMLGTSELSCAGRTPLGTEAACFAFTDPNAVKIIQERLVPLGISLEDHKAPFWVLVSMKRAIGDQREEAIRGTLTIERVDTFKRR